LPSYIVNSSSILSLKADLDSYRINQKFLLQLQMWYYQNWQS